MRSLIAMAILRPEAGLMGIYVDNMRYISALTLMFGDTKPHSSGAQMTDDNVELITHLSGIVRVKALPVGGKTADIEFSSAGLKIIKADGVKFTAPDTAKKKPRTLRPQQG